MNNYLYDGNNKIYKIIDIKDLGNYNKPWKFEFFNPMRKIELVLEEVHDILVKQKINSLLSELDENNV